MTAAPHGTAGRGRCVRSRHPCVETSVVSTDTFVLAVAVLITDGV